MLIIFALWTAYGAFNAVEGRVEALYASEKSPLQWMVFNQFIYSWYWALLTPLILFLAGRFRPDQKPYWPNTLFHLVSACVFAVFAKLSWLVFVGLTQAPQIFVKARFMRSLTYMIDYPFMLYIVVLVSFYAVEYYSRYQRGLINAAELQAQLARAQLSSLKAQLHPHFLFNALHTISCLVHDDPSGAERMIARLSELLRLAMHQSAVQLVPLATELEYLNLYLDIEKVRFEDRLSVNMEIEPSTMVGLVPSLILQPLVENAIRHGIGKRPGPGQVTVRSVREGDRLLLDVIDDGLGLNRPPGQPIREGVGLSTVRGRLERLFGSAQSLVLKNLSGGGVEASIVLPFQAQSMAGPTIFEGAEMPGQGGAMPIIHEGILPEVPPGP